MKHSEYMTVKELAEHYGRHVDTIRRWIKAGRIPSIQLAGPRGWLLVRKDAILKEGLK
jgi:excisionase family DNA binding protein